MALALGVLPTHLYVFPASLRKNFLKHFKGDVYRITFPFEKDKLGAVLGG